MPLLWTWVTFLFVTNSVSGLVKGLGNKNKLTLSDVLNAALINMTGEISVPDGLKSPDESDQKEIKSIPVHLALQQPFEFREKISTSTSKAGVVNLLEDGKLPGQTVVIRFPEQLGSVKGHTHTQRGDEPSISVTDNLLKVLEKTSEQMKLVGKPTNREGNNLSTKNSLRLSTQNFEGRDNNNNASRDDVKEQIQATYKKLSEDFKKLEELMKKQEEAEKRAKADTSQTVEGVNNIITIENVHTNLGNFTRVTLCKRRSVEVNHHLPLPDQNKKKPPKKKKLSARS